tara:strand:- start:8134 stop:11535 length:3402 start_codon:yes stop_codon:yes gene_type:complete
MSAKDFKFVSPGVFVEEIDNSQVPALPEAIGPLVIGRSRRGPALQPVKVNSFSEFVTIFGNPVGGQEASDLWRSGVPTAPTFAAYAAQAWLRNNNSLTFYRLLGEQSPDADATDTATAGWKSSDASALTGGGAYGLFLFNSGSAADNLSLSKEAVDGTLAAIFYVTEGIVTLSGSLRGYDGTAPGSTLPEVDGCTTTSSCAMVVGTNKSFTATVFDGTNSGPVLLEKTNFSFNRDADNYIRKVFNTNPTLTNTHLVDAASANRKTVFLGQTFEREVATEISSSDAYGMIMRLGNSSRSAANGGNFKFGSQKARTGWFFSQDLRNTAADTSDVGNNQLTPRYDAAQSESVTRLFRLHGLSSGEDLQRNYKVSIEDIKYSKNDNNPYGTFSLAIRSIKDSDNAKRYVERFTNLSLDPNSENYMAKQIGDLYREYDNSSRRLIEYGSYPNRSSIIRVEMANAVDTGQTDPELLPFGAEGPMKFTDFEVITDDELVAATATITFTGDATVNQTIVITSTDGTERTYTAKTEGNAGAGTYDCNNGPETSATTLAAAINNAAGHSGKITATNPTATSILLTQDVAGVAGNKAITNNLSNSSVVGGSGGSNTFQGGSDDTNPANGVIGETSPVTAGTGSNGVFMAPTGSTEGSTSVILQSFKTTPIAFTGSVKFPSVPLRVSASDGDISDPTEAYFGVQTNRSTGSVVFEESIYDLLYPLPSGLNQTYSNTANNAKVSWYFSLDDLVANYKGSVTNRDSVYYQSGSRAGGYSMTAISGSYKKILDIGYDRFTSVFYNGFNGFDITEEEPFNSTRALPEGSAETTHAMFYSTKKAVDLFADPEFIEANILTAPGIVNEGITTHMINTCEDRGDALAIIDPRGGYLPASENEKAEKDRIKQYTGSPFGAISAHVKEVADNLDLRNLNSSYGAAYYPWVRISDTISGRNLWAPPSVAALGALSFSEKRTALWFAPAGFNRGGLSQGAAGIPVTNVRSKLSSAERDYLYERNVNPIASFPSEGIVIFGQKTLQVTPSALDRINVRRLMIFVKKEISRIASTLLFEQNVEATWSRFTGQVGPFLENIKNNFGLDDFRVVLDETTTTPDLIDRNTIYAKIFLKPTKAVEFFAIDFVITNSGAGFED